MLFKDEFMSIIEDLLECPKFEDLKEERHHGTSRYNHLLRVAKETYKVAKKKKLNYVEATRGALLHDFYLNSELRTKNKVRMTREHPNRALKNAKKCFKLTEIEEDCILKHMYPLTTKMPIYPESWLVSRMDKKVAAKEMAKYKLLGRDDE